MSFSQRFDEYFETINKDRKRMEMDITSLQANHKKMRSDLDVIFKNVNKQFDENMATVFDNIRLEAEKFRSLEEDMKDVRTFRASQKNLETQM